MWKIIIECAITCCVLSHVQALDMTPRASLYKAPVDVFHSLNEKDSLASLKRSVIIKGDKDESNENIVCKHDKCIVTVDATISDKKSKLNKVSTDVQVIVSSDVNVEKGDTDTSSKKDNDKTGDVPVLKGYNGVNIDDINWNDDSEEDKAHNEDEEPSTIITSPYNGETIIINPGKTPMKPEDRMLPPKVDWNNNYPNNKGVRIPSGWTSNWKPSYPPPGDYDHYSGGGNRRDFPGYVPMYRNVCKCSREPIYPGRSGFYPSRPSPWYPIETTTKQIIDDKLSPPFSVKQKRNVD